MRNCHRVAQRTRIEQCERMRGGREAEERNRKKKKKRERERERKL